MDFKPRRWRFGAMASCIGVTVAGVGLVAVAGVGLAGSAVAGPSPAPVCDASGLCTVTFVETGYAQTFTVPVGVTILSATVDGASGGPGNDGDGDYPPAPGGATLASLHVVPGEVLTVVVGQQGVGQFMAPAPRSFGGGGAGANSLYSGGAGGGGSFVGSPSSLLLAAGGGGGSYSSDTGGAGAGAGQSAGSGQTSGAGTTTNDGLGATPTSPGAGGHGGPGGGGPATITSFDTGANAISDGALGGAGGGGGYYGGGSGYLTDAADGVDGAAGGGSGYANPDAALVSGVSAGTAAVGDGLVVFSYRLTVTVTAPSASVVYGQSIPALTPTYSGFTGGDSASSLTPGATCTTTATSTSAPGSYPVTCSGAVDTSYVFSYVAGTVTITPAATVTAVAASPASATTTQPVTVTATITPTNAASGATGAPGGTVAFYVDGSATPAASVRVSGGVATFTTTLGDGSHSVTATYSGDTDYLASTSNGAADLTVTAPTTAPVTAPTSAAASPDTGAPAVASASGSIDTGRAGDPRGPSPLLVGAGVLLALLGIALLWFIESRRRARRATS